MTRALRGVLALALSWLISAAPAAAQMTLLLGAGPGAPVAAAASSGTWAAVAASDTLTNSSRTVTKNAVDTQTMPRTTGSGIDLTDKKFFEITCTWSNPAFIGVGVVYGPNVGNNGHYIGESADSAGLVMNGALAPSGSLGAAPSSGGTLLVAVDGVHNKIYFWFGGLWNNGINSDEPTTNTGGIVMTGINYPVLPMASLYKQNDACTINLGGSGYVNSTKVTQLQGAGFSAYTGL